MFLSLPLEQPPGLHLQVFQVLKFWSSLVVAVVGVLLQEVAARVV